MTTNKLLILKVDKNTSKTIRPRHGQQVSDDDLYLSKLRLRFPAVDESHSHQQMTHWNS